MSTGNPAPRPHLYPNVAPPPPSAPVPPSSSDYPSDNSEVRSQIISILSDCANGCLNELGYYPGMPQDLQAARTVIKNLEQALQERDAHLQSLQEINTKLFDDNRVLKTNNHNLTELLNQPAAAQAQSVHVLMQDVSKLTEENKKFASQYATFKHLLNNVKPDARKLMEDNARLVGQAQSFSRDNQKLAALIQQATGMTPQALADTLAQPHSKGPISFTIHGQGTPVPVSMQMPQSGMPQSRSVPPYMQQQQHSMPHPPPVPSQRPIRPSQHMQSQRRSTSDPTLARGMTQDNVVRMYQQFNSEQRISGSTATCASQIHATSASAPPRTGPSGWTPPSVPSQSQTENVFSQRQSQPLSINTQVMQQHQQQQQPSPPASALPQRHASQPIMSSLTPRPNSQPSLSRPPHTRSQSNSHMRSQSHSQSQSQARMGEMPPPQQQQLPTPVHSHPPQSIPPPTPHPPAPSQQPHVPAPPPPPQYSQYPPSHLYPSPATPENVPPPPPPPPSSRLVKEREPIVVDDAPPTPPVSIGSPSPEDVSMAEAMESAELLDALLASPQPQHSNPPLKRHGEDQEGEEEERKKPRLDADAEDEEDEDEEEDDEEEEEMQEVDENGLRPVGTCIRMLMEETGEEEVKMCRLCRYRKTYGADHEVKPFIRASMEELHQHFLTQHASVFETLRRHEKPSLG